MKQNELKDEWLWRIYRAVAQYVHSPNVINETEVTDLVQQYRQQAETPGKGPVDEHEWALNFR